MNLKYVFINNEVTMTTKTLRKIGQKQKTSIQPKIIFMLKYNIIHNNHY